MIASHDALRRIAWAALLAVACALLFGMSLMVNAVRSDVRRTELKILSMKREMLYLDTEFETRANQQQLEAWNDVDFGYVAPTASQYLADRRALALLGKPVAAPAAPSPVLLAAADTPAAAPAVVAPVAKAADTARPSVPEVRPVARPAKDEPAKLAERRHAKPGPDAKLAEADRAAKADREGNSAREAKPAREAKLAKVKPAPAATPAKEKPALTATPSKAKRSAATRLAKAERRAADRTRLAAVEITP